MVLVEAPLSLLDIKISYHMRTLSFKTKSIYFITAITLYIVHRPLFHPWWWWNPSAGKRRPVKESCIFEEGIVSPYEKELLEIYKICIAEKILLNCILDIWLYSLW